MTLQVTICGGGNAAHTLVGILGSRADLVVRVYAPYGDEAVRWQAGVTQHGGIKVITPDGVQLGKVERISARAGEVLPGSEIIILALPAFAHESTLEEIAPHLDSGAWIGAMPARGGFDLGARLALDIYKQHVTLFGFQTLPWACRIRRYGQEAQVLGAKERVDITSWPPEQVTIVARKLEMLLGVRLDPVGSFLELSLADVGQLIHPGIMYGLFHNWDGNPYPQPPPFYQGVDDEIASILLRMSDEVQMICLNIKVGYSGLDFSAVRPLKEWLLRSYRSSIADATTLRSCFVTNRGYAGLIAPVSPVAGGYVPDFSARYLAEDVPFGLLVTRGIAELAGVATPVIDRVVSWSQTRLGRQYLHGGHLHTASLQATRAPQRYGITSLEELLETLPVTGRSSMSSAPRLTPTDNQ